MSKQIYRSSHNAFIGGVCGGLGEYFDIDPVLVRVIWLFAVFSGIGVLVYFLCWLLIPKKPLGVMSSDQDQYEDGYYNETYYEHRQERREKTKLILGAGLIIIGSFSLMKRFMPWFDFNLIWPIMLILGGFYLIYREKDNHDEE